MKAPFEITHLICVSAEVFPQSLGIVERVEISTVVTVTIAVFLGVIV
jgi:Mg2+/Co2+ transporter CorB